MFDHLSLHLCRLLTILIYFVQLRAFVGFSELLCQDFSSLYKLIFLFMYICSINTVYYMAPFATMILALPALLLEGNGVIEWLNTHPYPWSALTIIFSSGVLAFCLNFSIFYVIHSTTAVTFNVAGNLKVRSMRHNFQATLLIGSNSPCWFVNWFNSFILRNCPFLPV